MRSKIILLTMATVTALVTLDATIVGVALPSIAQSLHATFADVEWVIGGYVLCFASLLTPVGVWGDHRGRRGAVLIGVSLFAIASLLCGIATTAAMLIAARVLQAIGAAFLPPAGLGIIGDTFRGADRARAFGIWGSVLGLAIISGPIVGGIVTSLWGWRWTFLINIPICVALIVATMRWVPDSRNPQATRYDVAGSLTFCAALFLLTWALIDPHEVVWRVGGAVAMLAAFITIERRQQSPMLDLSLFGRPAFLGAVVAMLGYAAAAQVLIYFLPLYLQNGFGYSPMMCGMAMLPFAVPLFVMPRLGARASVRYGNRAVLAGGLTIVALGDVCLGYTAPLLSYPWFAVAMAITGIGAGLLNGETAQTLQSTIPPERGGMIGGLSATVRFTGILLAVALLGVILSHVAAHDFALRAARAMVSVDGTTIVRRVIAGDRTGALHQVAPALRALITTMARSSVATGITWLMISAAVVAAVSAILVRRLLPARAMMPARSGDMIVID